MAILEFYGCFFGNTSSSRPDVTEGKKTDTVDTNNKQ